MNRCQFLPCASTVNPNFKVSRRSRKRQNSWFPAFSTLGRLYTQNRSEKRTQKINNFFATYWKYNGTIKHIKRESIRTNLCLVQLQHSFVNSFSCRIGSTWNVPLTLSEAKDQANGIVCRELHSLGSYRLYFIESTILKAK